MNNLFAILSLIVCIPLGGMLFALMAKEDENKNPSNVAIFTIISNLVVIWRVFMLINEKENELQLYEKFDWLGTPNIDWEFAVDTLSLLLILAVHLVILIGIVFVRPIVEKQKSLMVFTLLFLSMTTGMFVSADIFSFFIFFEAMILPFLMLIGIFGELKKSVRLSGFFLYNLIGALVLFAAILLIYKYYGNLSLDAPRRILWKKNCGWFIWGALAFGFISRIPIWPFHYWISSISSKLHNPLLFIEASILPLSGIYGLLRLWPQYIPLEISQYFVWVYVIGTVTMLFISLIGFIHKEAQYKVFSFVTVYYVMYLLGIFSGDKIIIQNLGYALFGFLIIVAALEALTSYVYHPEQRLNTISSGFLCRAKRLSLLYSFLTFVSIGFPVSAMFTNNFLILSQLLFSNLQMGILMMIACLIVSGTLISEMFRLKEDNKECLLEKSDDLSVKYFIFMLFIVFILLMSFIRPLWFVVSE
ncbi:MAG: hypothetical protein MJ210_02635 [Alphaproteobacteria bacterium]|nr:hypothetical protein [Alphaproteobacteria bacterium]